HGHGRPVRHGAAVADTHHHDGASRKTLLDVIDKPDQLLLVVTVVGHIGRHGIQPVLKDDHVVIHVLVELPVDAVIGTEQGEPAVAAYREVVDADAHAVFQHRTVADEPVGMRKVNPQPGNIGFADTYPLYPFAEIGNIIAFFGIVHGHF